ncbi:NUDIX domain-containing protein [Microlunatus speluncae]|uniref:NUDIX domain-containing protein n=1 Tax=Microlunatus speluncae TaxID=2594267 RepID=UPI0012666963|nr:NUDIX domain-containing protein [Microlunatus speluncae]
MIRNAVRRSSRVLLFGPADELVLIKRTRPGVAPYLTTPGGGVEPGETWDQAAVRECREELGATVIIGPVAYVMYLADREPGSIQRYALGRLITIDDAHRHGPEFEDPGRGLYETVRCALDDPDLDRLRPAELLPVLRGFGSLLAAEARTLKGG